MAIHTHRGRSHHDLFQEFDAELLIHAQIYLQNRQQNRPLDLKLIEAWTRFFEACDFLLHRFAISCHVAGNDEDDCVQAAWKDITISLLEFQHQGEVGQFCAWLRKIIFYKASDLRRQRARHPTCPLDESLADKLISRCDEHVSFQEQQDRHDKLSQVMRNMKLLVTATNFQVFQQHWIEGISINQIADELVLPKKEIRYRASRMKHKFLKMYRSLLGSEEIDD